MEIADSLKTMKNEFEKCIRTAIFEGETKSNGQEAKKSLVRSTKLINYLHESIKHEIVKTGIHSTNIYPAIGQTKGELRLTGFLKQKKQDICIKPNIIKAEKISVSWGPMKYQKKKDVYGPFLTERIISINVRSQLSSMEKNFDTLMERTFAESCNLHEKYPNMCLGEVYFILTHSYDDKSMKNNQVKFQEKQTNLEKYISFFHSINQRKNNHDRVINYERCALIIADFREEVPRIFKTTEELRKCGYVSSDFKVELSNLSIDSFVEDLLTVYDQRFGIDLLLK